MPIDEDWSARTVTVVDDEPVVQDVLVRAARSWNYDCQAAGTAEQALELLERRLTPIVVTDLRMPGRGGVWLVREIRRRWPEVGVIVLTAGQDDESARLCLEAGADHYFVKPVKLDELHHVLERTRHVVSQKHEDARSRRRLERAVRRQTRRVRHTFLRGIDSLVRAMEERDAYTAGHSVRVREYALRLARAIGLDDRQQRQLDLAAKLHDIGKVGVPEAVLNKPGPLTLAESLIVREHPGIGERILAPIVRSRAVLAAIRSHHERIDGGGYPDGLKGSRIPLLGRVIAIADCFDALTSARAYRDPLSVPQALDTLRAGAGSHFQAEFVRAFVEVIDYRPVTGGVG
jgi:response regulator RpfG family c-di-GMP phosphodiesterase